MSTGVQIVLLGGARIEGRSARLDKRTAAILALLAVDGPQSRSRVAGLLWPDSNERTARNNLAQALRRLRASTEIECVRGETLLELTLACDVTQLFEDRAELTPRSSPALLAGLDYDDLPDLDSWLTEARSRVRRAWIRRAMQESERRQREGELDEAIAWIEACIQAEPISEASYLQWIELLLLRGDAAAAMRVYERCKLTLARELGMAPSPRMLESLQAIRAAKSRRATQAQVPLRVLRPPRIGREREWALLHHEHAAGRGVIVHGEPGLGKTRLVRDYCSLHTDTVFVEGRPSDEGVLLSSLGRAVRSLWPRIARALPPWAHTTLAPLAGEAEWREHERMQLLDALACALSIDAKIASSLWCIDDWQWLDEASAEACRWLVERAWRGELPRFTLVVHRAEDLDAKSTQWRSRCIEMGLATPLALQPLSQRETMQMVEALEIPALTTRATALAQASGGIPLFALELARGALADDALPEGAALPERVKALVRRRLERLSPAALRLARVAAIAGTEMSVELAAYVLETPVLDLAEAWSELERAQVMIDAAFTHDVLAEAIREAVPPLVRAYTHRRIATGLQRVEGRTAPGRIAAHLLAAGDEDAALPYLLAAAEIAYELGAVDDLIHTLERAASIQEANGDLDGAFASLTLRMRCVLGAEASKILAWFARVARSPAQKAHVAFARASDVLDRGRFAEAEKAALAVEKRARKVGERQLEAEAAQLAFGAQLAQGALELAAESLDRLQGLVGDLEDPWIRMGADFNAGELHAARGEHHPAIAQFLTALHALETWNKLRPLQVRAHAAIAIAHLELGELEAAEAAVARIDSRVFREDPFFVRSASLARIACARVALARGEPEAARAWLKGAQHANLPAVRAAEIARLLDRISTR